MKKNRMHPVFYAFGFLMIMGVAYQGNPHHYFPFMNKEKDGDSGLNPAVYHPVFRFIHQVPRAVQACLQQAI